VNQLAWRIFAIVIRRCVVRNIRRLGTLIEVNTLMNVAAFLTAHRLNQTTLHVPPHITPFVLLRVTLTIPATV
jgi:hypothetical protein